MTPQIKSICAFAIICLLSLIVFGINLNRKNRKHQLPVPVIAGLSSVIATVLLLVNKSGIIEKINIWGLAPDEKLKKVDYIYSVEELVNTDIFLFNAAIILIWVAVKLISLFVIGIACAKPQEDEGENSVYFYDVNSDVWFLKEEWVYFRSLVNKLAVSATVLSAVFSAVRCYVGHTPPLWIYFASATRDGEIVLTPKGVLNGKQYTPWEKRTISPFRSILQSKRKT